MSLREARRRARYTQQQVADLLGVSRPTIARMEARPEEVSISDAQRLAELYGVTIDKLFFLKED